MTQSKGVTEDNFINRVFTKLWAGLREPTREKHPRASKYRKPLLLPKLKEWRGGSVATTQ